jgi:chemotaxis response regulator CheB
MSEHTVHATPLHAAAPPAFPVIVMAASAGGIAALCHIFGAFPVDLPAAVAVVQHRNPQGKSLLATVRQNRVPQAEGDPEEDSRMLDLLIKPTVCLHDGPSCGM